MWWRCGPWESTSQWNSEHTFIFTYTRFDATRTLKGQTSKMKGEAYVDDQLVAEAELLATVVDRRPA